MSEQRRSKPYQFKPPPYLSGDTSLHINFALYLRTTKNSAVSNKRLHINLSQVEEVDVLGLASIAANIAKSVMFRAEFEYQVLLPESPKVAQMFTDLRFESLLSDFGMRPALQSSLWSVPPQATDQLFPWAAHTVERSQLLVFIPSSAHSDREATLTFIRAALQRYYDANPSDAINYGQVHQILHEIVKNSIDHSLSHAVLALKIETLSGCQRLSFIHCELGIGVVKSVRSFLGRSESNEHRTLAQKGDISALLHWAFNPGNSTRPDSSVNAGLGLSTIKAAAKGGDIRVSLFDAKSGVYINRLPGVFSHGAIRKALYSVHAPPCFMYIGHTTDPGKT